MIKDVICCRDCIYLSCTTIGMPYACWHDYYTIDETGKENGHTVCRRIDDLDHYCSFAKSAT